MVRIEARLTAPTAGLDGGRVGELSSLPFALLPFSASAIVPLSGEVDLTGPEALPGRVEQPWSWYGLPRWHERAVSTPSFPAHGHRVARTSRVSSREDGAATMEATPKLPLRGTRPPAAGNLFWRGRKGQFPANRKNHVDSAVTHRYITRQMKSMSGNVYYVK
jgi:hypothetical protein